MADVVEHWYGQRPEIFENRDLDLAVARGAAYYSYVRSTGSGVLVRGGLPRTYYIGAGRTREGKFPAVCLVPRGAEEGATLEIDNDALQLVANRPVSFRLYSSLTRTDDTLGQVLEFDAADADLHLHAPLNAVIRFGKKADERLIPVKLGARLTEIGTLEIWCESKISDNRWRLQFELRKTGDGSAGGAQGRGRGQRAGAESVAGTDRGGVLAVGEIADRARGSPGQAGTDPGAGQELLAALRHPAAGRRVPGGRRRPQEEPGVRDPLAQSGGFCLRPGFGFPGDDFRIEQARRVYAAGLTYGNQVQSEIDWWIFWGRVAGGLNRNQQTDIYQRLSGFLLPRGSKKPQRVNPSLLREMWRCAASLELLPMGTKTELGDALVKRVKAGDFKDSELWCLAALGARKLFYGPINQVVPPATATRWVEALLRDSQLPATRWPRWRAAPKTPRAICPPPRARRCGASWRRCRMPTACWRCSMAKKRTTRAGAHLRRGACPRGWCWWSRRARSRETRVWRLCFNRSNEVESARLSATEPSLCGAAGVRSGMGLRWCLLSPRRRRYRAIARLLRASLAEMHSA